MTTAELQRYYDVSLPPSLFGGAPAPARQASPKLPADVGAFTVAQIEDWVAAHPDQRDAVLAAEQARPTPRVTLVTSLEEPVHAEEEPDE
jgi:hypothetical protein